MLSDDELRGLAVDAGASDALAIPAENVVVDNVVALRCQYGCAEYGRWLTCPPHSPDPEKTRQVLSEYRRCLLVALDVPSDPQLQMDEEDEANPDEALTSTTTDVPVFRGMGRKLFKLVAEVERRLFLAGHYRAFGFAAGHCPFCKECNLARPCRFPSLSRPSMEASGIDVFSTLRNSGWANRVLTDPKESFRIYALVLVD